MARVFIDSHMFSETWFLDPLKELIDCRHVSFLFSHCEKLTKEVSTCLKSLRFFQQMARMNKLCRTDDTEVAKHIKLIMSLDSFCKCGDCDDEHIFAMIYVKPTPYVFSMDMRIAKCRSNIQNHLDNRYCNFIVIANANVYKRHKGNILS